MEESIGRRPNVQESLDVEEDLNDPDHLNFTKYSKARQLSEEQKYDECAQMAKQNLENPPASLYWRLYHYALLISGSETGQETEQYFREAESDFALAHPNSKKDDRENMRRQSDELHEMREEAIPQFIRTVPCLTYDANSEREDSLASALEG
jgi:hypothetical protein